MLNGKFELFPFYGQIKKVILQLILLPLPDYLKVTEVLFPIKILDVEFSLDLYVLRSPEFKVVFENQSVRMYVRMWVWLQGEYLALYIFKTNKDRSTKFYTEYQTSAIFPTRSPVLKKNEKPEVGWDRPEMKPEVNISKKVLEIFFKFDK